MNLHVFEREAVFFFPTFQSLTHKYFYFFKSTQCTSFHGYSECFLGFNPGKIFCILLEEQQISTPHIPDNLALMSRLCNQSSFEQELQQCPKPDTHDRMIYQLWAPPNQGAIQVAN